MLLAKAVTNPVLLTKERMFDDVCVKNLQSPVSCTTDVSDAYNWASSLASCCPLLSNLIFSLLTLLSNTITQLAG